jgi:hypothetical protein
MISPPADIDETVGRDWARLRGSLFYHYTINSKTMQSKSNIYQTHILFRNKPSNDSSEKQDNNERKRATVG